MDDKVNLAEKVGLLAGPYSPGIVGYLNDYKLAVVKVLGEFVWPKHDDTDDFFLVLRGRITIQLRDRNVELAEGEMFVVPRGALPQSGSGGSRAPDRAEGHGEHRRRRRRVDLRGDPDLVDPSASPAGFRRRLAARGDVLDQSWGRAPSPSLRPRHERRIHGRTTHTTYERIH